MKAWEVSFNGYLDNEDDTNGIDYVFAKNATEAKQAVVEGRTLLDDYLFDDAKDNGAKYTDIRVKREPDLDECYKKPEIVLAEKLITKCGWTWNLGDKTFDEDNFNKQEFEKAFIEDGDKTISASCAICGKEIHSRDKLWVIIHPRCILNHYCSFECLVEGLNKFKDIAQATQDNSDEFIAKHVILHKFYHMY